MKPTFLVYFFNGVAAPFVRCKLFDKDAYLLVDTGSNDNLLDKHFFDTVGYQGEIQETGDMVTAGGAMGREGEIATDIEINGSSFSLRMAVADIIALSVFEEYLGERPVGMLGIDFLVKEHMIMDFEHWCMYRVTAPIPFSPVSSK